MATADSLEALRAEIATTTQQVQAEQARGQELQAQIRERQRLQRKLSQQRRDLASERALNQSCAKRLESAGLSCSGERLNFANGVLRREYVWEIAGLSWLTGVMLRDGDASWWSDEIGVGNHVFFLAYSPTADELMDGQHGSLAVVCTDHSSILFRASIYIKQRGGDFVQWGETIDALHHNPDECQVYGPDVYWGRGTEWDPEDPPPRLGIFGLSHQELLRSEWVEQDTLTVKLLLEVLPEDARVETLYPEWAEVPVPEPTIGRDMEVLWSTGICSDMHFIVQEEVIEAHSQVLCARSQVFRTQLLTGMQESMSKVIEIADCDVGVFKAFLHFLYTDNLASVEEAGSSCWTARMLALQAVSHKYQVDRLQIWCEKQLCEHIANLSDAEVCDVLCQAHLLDAKRLEKACLSYIKDHMSTLIQGSAFASMLKKWPEVMLKVGFYNAGIPETEWATAVESVRNAGAAGVSRERGSAAAKEP